MQKNVISPETLEKVKKIEEKISKALIRFADEFNCPVTEVYIRILGNDEGYPTYSVIDINGTKLKDATLGEIIPLSTFERILISEEKINESVFLSLDKINIGFEGGSLLSQLEVLIYTRTQEAKPLFYLYKDTKPHKQIQSYQII
jgi:hypothetical protein